MPEGKRRRRRRSAVVQVYSTIWSFLKKQIHLHYYVNVVVTYRYRHTQTWVLSFFSGYYFPINIPLSKRIFYPILYPGNSGDISPIPIPILYPKTGYISP